MNEELLVADSSRPPSINGLRRVDGELSARVDMLRDTVSQLRTEAKASAAAVQHAEQISANKAHFLAAAVHDLRQPLQTLSLIHDALTITTHDAQSLKFVERMGNAVSAASNILSRISEISRVDTECLESNSKSRNWATSSNGSATSQCEQESSNILIIEDDPDLARSMELNLSSSGYQVSVAADGWQALELASPGARWPDLVITNYSLPNNLNGLDTVASLRERLDHEIGAIILTNGELEGIGRTIDSHGCMHLVKPVKSSELTATVRMALEQGSGDCVPPPIEEAGTDAPTVFVIDDNTTVLEAMRELLQRNGRKVECFTNGSAFFATCAKDRRGCVLVDARMPDMDGFQILERLRAENHAVSAIMITGAGDVPMAVRAMKAGAVDFIEKPVNARELLGCLQSALKPRPSEVAASSRHDAVAARFATLTERQRQIVDLILAGEPNKLIAYRLGLSQRTVESHRAAIMRKTGAKSFAALVRWAIAVN